MYNLIQILIRIGSRQSKVQEEEADDWVEDYKAKGGI